MVDRLAGWLARWLTGLVSGLTEDKNAALSTSPCVNPATMVGFYHFLCLARRKEGEREKERVCEGEGEKKRERDKSAYPHLV